MKPWYLYIAAALLLVTAVGLFSVPQLGPAPEVTCVEEGQPTSGFAIEIDGEECALGSEDFEKYWEWENNSALPLRRAGLAAVVLSIASAITGAVLQAKARKRRRLQGSSYGMPGPQGPFPGAPTA